ncbi:MAG: response regulator [Deltaproteobacteria bacterium]|nr:response regulator [Deltaproteobacteria bacterium]
MPLSLYKKKTILIVDDNKLVRKIISKYLLNMGFEEISLAENATEALTFMRQHPVDLLLTDIHMPVVSGLTLLKTLRNTAAFKQLKVLVISSENGLQYIKTAMAIGIEGYLVKPIQQADLQKKIEAVFQDEQTSQDS